MPPPSSLGYLLSRRSVWGLVLTQACLVYTAYLFITWLPTYLQSTHGLSIMNTGYATSIPYFVTMLLGLLIARISDRTVDLIDRLITLASNPLMRPLRKKSLQFVADLRSLELAEG